MTGHGDAGSLGECCSAESSWGASLASIGHGLSYEAISMGLPDLGVLPGSCTGEFCNVSVS